MTEEEFKKAAALQYDQLKDNAPRIKAKGQGHVAKNIIEIAKEHDIPIVEDADLIELLSKVEVDKEIPGKMYDAIAEVFHFIYEASKDSK